MSYFKVGDEVWQFRTHGYHSGIQNPFDLYLVNFVIGSFTEDGFMIAESGDYLDIEDLSKSYKSKKDAINAVIEHMGWL